MTVSDRIKSELPGGDPALMNRVAWTRRWTDREASTEYARNALQTASDGQGRRSRTEQGFALRTLAWQARWSGQFDAAMDYCLRAENFLSETDHPVTRASVYATLGMVHATRSRMDLAASAVERGVWLIGDMSDRQTASVHVELLVVQASIQQQTGERARAGMTLGRARELATDVECALVECETAFWHLANNEVERALQHAQTAQELTEESEARHLLPYIHCILGSCYARRENNIEALAQFKDAITLAEKAQDQNALCQVNLAQAQFELTRGHMEKARDLLLAAASIAKQQNMQLLRKQIALTLAEAFELLGQFKASVDQHKLAWRLEREGRVR